VVRHLDPSLPPALISAAPEGSSLTLALAGLGALLLHLFLILAVSIEMPEPGAQPTPEAGLEILVFKEAGNLTENPAPDAALSRYSRSGDAPDGDAVIRAPETDPEAPPEEIVEALPPEMPAPEAPAELTMQPEPEPVPAPAPEPEVEPPPEPEPEPDIIQSDLSPPDPLSAPRAIDAAQIFGSRQEMIASLDVSNGLNASKGGRLRRRTVSAATREFRYASYMAAWASKVERIGNLNYPQAAKEQRLHGNLILNVAVRKDGSVESIRVVRSSGEPQLDEAAIKIVELAAPFSPFPADIAAETDVLDIMRTWRFLKGGGLNW
jgi:protein TonB